MPIFRRKNENFFKKWSPEMAYVLGFFAADGAMTKGRRGNYYLELTSSDFDLLKQFRDLIVPEHKVSVSHKENGKRCFRLQIGSKEMFNDVLQLGFTTQKSKRLKLPKVPTKYFADFVRGYFDGDGHVWFGRIHKERTRPTMTLHAVFTSGSRRFLAALQNNLYCHLLYNGSLLKGDGNYYRLQYAMQASLSLYKFMYNDATLYLKRKRRTFDEYIKLRL